MIIGMGIPNSHSRIGIIVSSRQIFISFAVCQRRDCLTHQARSRSITRKRGTKCNVSSCLSDRGSRCAHFPASHFIDGVVDELQEFTRFSIRRCRAYSMSFAVTRLQAVQRQGHTGHFLRSWPPEWPPNLMALDARSWMPTTSYPQNSPDFGLRKGVGGC